MALITIDREKCVKCGACAEVCPARLILKKGDRPPREVPWAEKVCINCGHCVAVCPAGALTTSTMAVEKCPPLDDGLSVSRDQARQFLMSRRSIRAYLDKDVSRQTIESLMETVRYAPSGHNRQPVQWIVILDRSEVETLRASVLRWMDHEVQEKTRMAEGLRFADLLTRAGSGDDIIFRGAPHLVVAHAPKDDRMAHRDSTIALTWLELAARSEGLGACWAGYFDLALAHSPAVREALHLPTDHVAHGSMMLGYPKYRYFRIPLRREAPITWR